MVVTRGFCEVETTDDFCSLPASASGRETAEVWSLPASPSSVPCGYALQSTILMLGGYGSV